MPLTPLSLSFSFSFSSVVVLGFFLPENQGICREEERIQKSEIRKPKKIEGLQQSINEATDRCRRRQKAKYLQVAVPLVTNGKLAWEALRLCLRAPTAVILGLAAASVSAADGARFQFQKLRLV